MSHDPATDDDACAVPPTSPDLKSELARALAELVPEAVTDNQIDVEKLRELLGDAAGDANERFGLFWPGKRQALAAAKEPTTATLVPEPDRSRDWDATNNIFIEGDNLEVLKILQRRYHSSIKLIYIDPPYNTGKDFIYPDNYAEGLQSYLEFTQQIDEGGKPLSSNSESDGRFHSNWLSMMYPRIKLARNLLTFDGVMLISIDDHEVDNLLKIANEIFGESNHITTFVWKNKTGGGNDAKDVTSEHEYCLMYARDIRSVTKLVTEVDDAETYTFGDEYEAERGKYKLEALYRSSLRYSDRLFYPIQAPDGSTILPNDSNPSSNRHIWRWSPDTFAQKFAEGRVEFKLTSNGWRVFSKQYLLQDDEGQPRTKGIRTVLDFVGSRRGTEEVKALFGGRKVFDYPKPVDYLKYYIKAVTDPADVVLDFFAGSASSAHAVIAANADDGGARSFIQVQLPEPTEEGSEARSAGFQTIAELARRRIELAGEKVVAENGLVLDARETPLDVGFRAYRLADTNFTRWHVSSAVDSSTVQEQLFRMLSSSDDDASPDAILVELLLKLGYSLSEQVERAGFAGLVVQSIAGGQALALVDEHVKPTLEQLRAMVESGAKRLIVLEDAFQGDDELKTNLVQMCNAKSVELRTA